MDESLLKKVDDYIEKNYWFSEWRQELGKSQIKFSIRLVDESDEEVVQESWTQRLKKKFDYILANMKEDTFSQRLWKLIKAKGMSDVEVYKKANLDRRLFSKIRNEKSYKPSKGTAIALGLALELNEDEFEDLVKRAGFALSGGNKEDVIVNYFIGERIYDVSVINDVLVHYGFPTLGERKT